MNIDHLAEDTEAQDQLNRRVYVKALDILARRELCTRQLQEKLAKAFPDCQAPIAKACARLQQEGYLSDERYAESYVRSRKNKGFGPNRIVRELTQKGVSQTLAKTAVVQAGAAQESPHEAIFRAWSKKFKQPPATYEEKSKQLRFLIYRGFSISEAQAFMERVEEQFS